MQKELEAYFKRTNEEEKDDDEEEEETALVDQIDQEIAVERVNELPQVNNAVPINNVNEEREDLQAPLLAE